MRHLQAASRPVGRIPTPGIGRRVQCRAGSGAGSQYKSSMYLSLMTSGRSGSQAEGPAAAAGGRPPVMAPVAAGLPPPPCGDGPPGGAPSRRDRGGRHDRIAEPFHTHSCSASRPSPRCAGQLRGPRRGARCRPRTGAPARARECAVVVLTASSTPARARAPTARAWRQRRRRRRAPSAAAAKRRLGACRRVGRSRCREDRVL